MRWIWIDKFISFEPRRRAVALKNVTRAETHLHDQYPAYPLMPTSLMIEGMAQTAGILVGHARDFNERVVLAKIRRARVQRPALPGERVTYTAVLEHIDDAGAVISGTVAIDDESCGQIDLVFSHLSRAGGAATGVPEDNFVFNAQFGRTFGTTGLDAIMAASKDGHPDEQA